MDNLQFFKNLSGEGNGNLLYGVHGVAESPTRLSNFTFFLSIVPFNPLQCSCLEHPMDGEAWWAAVYGVTQSQTWLRN